MKISVRPAVESDKLSALRVESLSTPKLQYLKRMWNDFTAAPEQPLFVAEVDGVIAGIGKFTILYDNSAWLETLRVDPEYQGQGFGKAIYKSYLAQAAKLNINKVRMYTGVNNAASAGLASINGFTLAGQYSGADLCLKDRVVASSHGPNFVSVSTERAVRLLQPLEKKWESFMIMNRTFYKMNESLYRAWAQAGFVYYDQDTESIIILGYRFMPERGLQIAIYHGDAEACFSFAVNRALKSGIDKLSIMLPPALLIEKDELTDYGFELQKSDCIVMERRG